MALKRVKNVYVLMYDDDGSKEKGAPQAVFTKMPKMEELLDWVMAEDVGEVRDAFKGGYLWFKTVPIG